VSRLSHVASTPRGFSSFGAASGRPRARTGRLLGVLAAVYALVVVAWAAARQTPLGSYWVFELADIFATLWLYAPLLVLGPWAMLRRQRAAAACLLVPLALFAVEQGEVFVPRPLPAPGPTLRLLTANLMWRNTDAASFAAVVHGEQPDMVAVQELGPDMAASLARDLESEYPYQSLAPSAGPDGIGIFSRLPFEGVQPAEIGRVPGPCFCQSVTVRVGNRAVVVLNAHPLAPDIRLRRFGPVAVPVAFDTDAGRPDRRRILERVEGADGPLILVGDLNTAERQPYYRELRRRLRDAHRDAGWGLGWTFPSVPLGPVLVPVVRIDHVLYSDAWRAADEYTGYTPGSDHRHVVADLVLARAQ
jgi:vancomycin resistance protein VanJ